MLKRLWVWFTQITTPQTTWCYCPSCKIDLCLNPDVTYEDDGEVVTYQCPCGHTSRWLFECIVPLLLKPGE